MAKIGQVTLTDTAGTKYTFRTYDLQTSFNPIAALYVFTRRTKNRNAQGYSHEIIYIGETGDIEERFGNHHRAHCIKNHKANCVGFLRESAARTRKRWETNLRNTYDPPCNRE